MQVLLQITAGPATGRRFRLRQGQVARIGRTQWADFSVPDDAEMADVHFELGCNAQSCWLRQVNAAEILRNGEPVEECRVRHGDLIAAGQSSFSVTLEGVSLDLPAVDPAADSPIEEEDRPRAAPYCDGLGLSDAARALLTEDADCDQFLDALLQQGLGNDAARFLAAWLPKAEAVGWGCACLTAAGAERLTPPQTAALRAAEAWSAEPTEENRRAAQHAAEALGGRTPAGWLAHAAFWSEGSIGPPEAADVPAAPGMSARAVGMAVATAATWDRDPASKLQQFIQQGRERLASKPP